MDKELIFKHLDKILQSKYFNKSKVGSDLLSYLVNASVEGKNLKEYTIGIELFGRKYDDDSKTDANIRVYIHNVRKKLNEYYEEEGAKDPIVFEIEKGKYNVSFKTRKEFDGKPVLNFKIPFFVASALLVIVCLWAFFPRQQKPNVWKKLPIWQAFANNDKKTLLVLGDYFVFSGPLPTGNSGVYRDFSINSEAEFEHLLDKKPELVQTLSKSNLTYLSKMAAFGQSDIYKVFAQTGGDIEVRLSSDMQPSDLKNYNIIFLGNYKNMGIFDNIIHDMHFPYTIENGSNTTIESDDPCSQTFKPENIQQKETDYALVVNMKGFSDNRFLFFMSSLDIGNIASVNQLTNAEYLQKFTSESLKSIDQDNFKALFKVEGINKTDLSMELIRVE